jgi:hypothetical protein
LRSSNRPEVRLTNDRFQSVPLVVLLRQVKMRGGGDRLSLI